MTHRDSLIENLDQLAGAKRDYLAFADAVRSRVLRGGPLRLDGNANEQLQNHLRALEDHFRQLDDITHRTLAIFDQVNRMRGVLGWAMVDLPPAPDGLGEPIYPDPVAVEPPVAPESAIIQGLKAERDADRARVAALEQLLAVNPTAGTS